MRGGKTSTKHKILSGTLCALSALLHYTVSAISLHCQRATTRFRAMKLCGIFSMEVTPEEDGEGHGEGQDVAEPVLTHREESAHTPATFGRQSRSTRLPLWPNPLSRPSTLWRSLTPLLLGRGHLCRWDCSSDGVGSKITQEAGLYQVLM